MIGHWLMIIGCAAAGTWLINNAAKTQSINDAVAGLFFFVAGYGFVVQLHG